MEKYSRLHKNLIRRLVKEQVNSGSLPRVADTPCFHCGNTASGYDHYKGYALRNAFMVLPVCRRCHTLLTWFRGEITYNEVSTNAKLNQRNLRRVRSALARGTRHKDIANTFDISTAAVSNIARGKTYVRKKTQNCLFVPQSELPEQRRSAAGDAREAGQ